jgi:hypothetical protein
MQGFCKVSMRCLSRSWVIVSCWRFGKAYYFHLQGKNKAGEGRWQSLCCQWLNHRSSHCPSFPISRNISIQKIYSSILKIDTRLVSETLATASRFHRVKSGEKASGNHRTEGRIVTRHSQDTRRKRMVSCFCSISKADYSIVCPVA